MEQGIPANIGKLGIAVIGSWLLVFGSGLSRDNNENLSAETRARAQRGELMFTLVGN